MSPLSPWQMLADLVPPVGSPSPDDRTRRERAAHTLLDTLRRLVRAPVGCLRSGGGGTLRIPETHHDDAVSAIAVKVVRGSIRGFVESLHDAPEHRDPKSLVYLRKMLRNWWIDQLRARARDPMAQATEADPADHPDPAPDDDPRPSLDAMRRDLERVHEAALEARTPRYREDLRVAWRQTWDLATETRTMDALLADELAAGTDRKTARDRIYKRCQRLREALLEAAARMHAAGALSDALHRTMVEAITRFLVRCQTSPPPPRPSP